MPWTRNSEGYAICFDHSDITYMHRLVTDAGPGQLVDHINGNKLDNRRANLRVTTASVNNQNRRMLRNSTSGHRGVTRAKGTRWYSRICFQGRQIHLGTYDTREQAALAYNCAAQTLFGEHAALNDVSGTLTKGTEASIQARIDGTYTRPRPQRVAPRKSPYRGVYWERGRWRAKIGHNYEKLHIGYYLDEEEAARAYDAKARALLGENARLNFPY
jgi:hypothetical protein